MKIFGFIELHSTEQKDIRIHLQKITIKGFLFFIIFVKNIKPKNYKLACFLYTGILGKTFASNN